MNVRIAKHHLGRRIIRPPSVTALGIIVAACAAAPLSAASSPPAGLALAQQAVAGQTNCAALTSPQFVVTGQTLMTRMLGPGAAQGAMTAHMQALRSADELNQPYRFVRRRFAGCATGNGPRSFGGLLGMIGGGMMGAGYRASSTMMASGDGLGHHGGTNSGTIVAIGVGMVALVGVFIRSALLITTRRRNLASPQPASLRSRRSGVAGNVP